MRGVSEQGPDAEIAGLLAAMLDEMRGIRVAVERSHRRTELSRADFDRLRQFLPAVFARMKGEIVLASEVAWFFAGKKTSKSIGRFLRRVERIPVDGLMVERAGREGNAALWRVVLTSPEAA